MKLKKIDRKNIYKNTKIQNWPIIGTLSTLVFSFGFGGAIL